MFNPEQPFSPADISIRAKVSISIVRREAHLLRKMGMIKGKRFSRIISSKKGNKTVSRRKIEGGWVLSQNFPYLSALRNLLINTVLINPDEIVRKLNSIGRIKLVVIAGIFIHDADSRVDLLIAGDNIRFGALENVIKSIESEIGKELRYSAFETADFQYRFGVYDKLVRDILDFPHKKILDKLASQF